MAIAYPLGLSTIQRQSKSRSQVPTFTQSDPRRGAAYFQEIGTDTPVFWDITFKFDKSDRVRFWLWFTQPQFLNRGIKKFTLPIKTEFGLVDHECNFLADSLMNVSEEGEIFTYTARIMARSLITPPDYSNAADMIVGLDDWLLWANLLDQTINIEWPKA